MDTLTKALKGLAEDMKPYQTVGLEECNDHKETCTDCSQVKVGEDE